MECTIQWCQEDATVLVIIDRPAGAVPEFAYWHGHMETPYCFTHAIQRPTENGITEFRDTWTFRPLTPRPGEVSG